MDSLHTAPGLLRQETSVEQREMSRENKNTNRSKPVKVRNSIKMAKTNLIIAK
jgi:hypothetical protein